MISRFDRSIGYVCLLLSGSIASNVVDAFQTVRLQSPSRKLRHLFNAQYYSIPLHSTVSDEFDDDEDNARSQFGTKGYWDDMYQGYGDFSSEEYSWYFGWEILEEYVKKYIPSKLEQTEEEEQDPIRILCPGVGNDPILVDLYRAKYTHLTAFDYSGHAIERQEDLLNYELPASAMDTIELLALDARKLPNPDWTGQYDAIIEKGALDAIYLSGDGNVERAIEELHRVLKPGGVCLSVSGVVPPDLRKECFKDWEWIRDGSNELKAGCFVLRKKTSVN